MHTPPPLKPLLSEFTTPAAASKAHPDAAPAIAAWEKRVRELQKSCLRPRCRLPAYMRCPVPGCGAPPFEGQDAWNQRMEHVAKHMERTRNGGLGRVVFGGERDGTLVEWAAAAEVGIIERKGDGEGWVLKGLLRRGPGGNVVVTAPVQGQGQQQGGMLPRGEREEDVIVVSQMVEGEDELDADGEDDD
ncbi:hypothetical protein VTI74DRAFT_820 [Chaetomium olivicolor]